MGEVHCTYALDPDEQWGPGVLLDKGKSNYKQIRNKKNVHCKLINGWSLSHLSLEERRCMMILAALVKGVSLGRSSRSTADSGGSATWVLNQTGAL
jgi:hypothetical protein